MPDSSQGGDEPEDYDAGQQKCDELYTPDYQVPPEFNMSMPEQDFLRDFNDITDFQRIKSLEEEIQSDILMQGMYDEVNHPVTLYEIISGDVLFRINEGFCLLMFDKEELDAAYQEAYSK